MANDKYQDFNRVRYRSQVEWITNIDGEVKVQHLLKFESLTQDFNNFLRHVGIEPFSLLVRNTALERTKIKRKLFPEYYTSNTTRQTVEDIWAADFKMFNYEKIR